MSLPKDARATAQKAKAQMDADREAALVLQKARIAATLREPACAEALRAAVMGAAEAGKTRVQLYEGEKSVRWFSALAPCSEAKGESLLVNESIATVTGLKMTLGSPYRMCESNDSPGPPLCTTMAQYYAQW